jgi:hypothetical protein
MQPANLISHTARSIPSNPSSRNHRSSTSNLSSVGIKDALFKNKIPTMVQHKLHRYFPSRRPFAAVPKTTFLHLPFNVRREIYLFSGLPTDITIYLNHIPSSNDHCIQDYDPNDRENWPIEPDITPRSFSLSHFLDGYLPLPQIHLNRHCACIDHRPNARYDASNWWRPCKCHPLPWQLLYVSKAIEAEVSSIFYSENHFSIFRDSLGGLSGLNSLPKAALRETRNLSVYLNHFNADSSLVGSRHFGRGRQFGPDSWDARCHATCAASKQQRLFSKAKRHHEMSSIHELQELCLVLKHHIQPNQLKLSFTCDAADIEIAEEVLRPLSELPLLRECAIRLGFLCLPDDPADYTPLQHLSEKHVYQLTKPSTHGKFNFTALPTEIQLQILSHTSLVTPYDLIWGINTPISTAIKSPFYEPRTFPWRQYPSLPECCNSCQPHPPSAPTPSPEICSCWTKYAAFSSTCTCWRFPLDLFMVSKSIKERAEAVFYSQNHFWILPMWCNGSRKLEIYHFLTRIGGARRYLRYLTWEMSWRVKDEWGG